MYDRHEHAGGERKEPGRARRQCVQARDQGGVIKWCLGRDGVDRQLGHLLRRG